jgi:hypothetical protein
MHLAPGVVNGRGPPDKALGALLVDQFREALADRLISALGCVQVEQCGVAVECPRRACRSARVVPCCAAMTAPVCRRSWKRRSGLPARAAAFLKYP